MLFNYSNFLAKVAIVLCYTPVHAGTHMHTHTHTHTSMHARTHTHIHMHTRTHAHTDMTIPDCQHMGPGNTLSRSPDIA